MASVDSNARDKAMKPEQNEDFPTVQSLSVAAENDTASSSVASAQESSVQSTPPTEPQERSNASLSSELQSSPGLKENDLTDQTPSYATSAAKGTGVETLAVPAETKPDEPILTPFKAPLPTCQPRARPQLTPEQQTKYDSLLATVEAWTELPTKSSKQTSPLSDTERMFLTRECLLRYLRATAWSTSQAAQRLQATLTWRREFGSDALTADYVSPENETGKQVILGFDNEARACLYLDPSRQNTNKSERQIQHLVFMLDRVIEMMHPGQETTALLINFKGSTAGGNPSVSQGRQVLNILQGHYPERLGRALISDLPWYVATFFKLISPFIDPVTREKMIFNQPLRDKHVPASQLWKNYGGDANFEYDHATYWPALNEICRQRREAYAARWEAAGKRIGEFEAYLRGGEQQSLSEVEKTPTAT